MEKIKTFYETDALNYKYKRWLRNPIAIFDYNETHKIIAEFLNSKSYDNSIEIGCGPGTWTPLVKKQSKNLTALDISENMIAIAKSNDEISDCNYINCDVENYIFDQKYNLIFSIRAFEYVKEKKELIQKYSENLSEGGELFIITKTRGSYWYGKSKVRAFLKKVIPILFYYEEKESNQQEKDNTSNFWQERLFVNDLRKMMIDAGLKNIKVRPVIIRPPIFMRGKSEIPIIPPILEKPALAVFKVFNVLFNRMAFFTIFAESYQISAEK